MAGKCEGTADAALTAVLGWLYDEAQNFVSLSKQPADLVTGQTAWQRRNQETIAAHLTGAVAHLAVYRADVLAHIETAITESSEASQ